MPFETPGPAVPGTLPRAVLAAGPDFLLGLAFLVTWITPSALGERMISSLVLVMLMEFITIHASALMGGCIVGGFDARTTTLTLLGLAVVYTVFAGGFSLIFATWWPLVTFWLLMLNRLLGLLLGRPAPEGEKFLVLASWGVAALVYLVLAGLTTLLQVPRLGVTPAAVSAAGLPGEGLWIDEPHRALAFGFFYFTAVALWELGGRGWAARRLGYENPGGGTKA